MSSLPLTALLFDFNGTLIRSGDWMDLEIRRLPRAALARLANGGHIPPPDAALLARADETFRSLRQRANRIGNETSHVQDLASILADVSLSGGISYKLIESTVADLHRECLASVELLPGATYALRRLRTLGLRLSILSNAAYPPFLHWTLERFELADYFEDVVVSADVSWRKPRPEIFRLALERLGLSAEAAAYVGDDFEKDVATPKRLGLRALWYRPEASPEDAARQPQPDAILASLYDLPDWVEAQIF
jgi:putative hydrolase of the HAD superfamily